MARGCWDVCHRHEAAPLFQRSRIRRTICRRCLHTSEALGTDIYGISKCLEINVCHSQPSQLQMRWFWWLEHPRSCRAMGTTSPCVHASPLLFLKPPPCCSNESLVEGFPRAGFIELCYRKIQLRQPRRSQNNLSFLILPVTSLGALLEWQ